MKHRLLYLFFGTSVLASCVKNPGDSPTTEAPAPDAIAPDNFGFATSKEVALDVKLLTNDDQPLAGVLVNVYDKAAPQSSLFTALTDADGRIASTLILASHVDSLLIDPAYVGLMRNATAVINGGAVRATIGGASGYGGDIVLTGKTSAGTALYNGRTVGTLGTTVVSYYGGYDNNGRPTTLATSDVISSELLSYVNTSLPEGRAVPNYHPEYLSNGAETNLNITKTSDVWITFVSEGAGYTNTLGFYKFPTNSPPQSLGDIDSIKIVIPNASLQGSGGTMRSGDKINIGRYDAGTSIGFVLLQNAWSSSSHTVNTNATKFFADDALNNESTLLKRHTVLLNDVTHHLFLYGFEDLTRTGGGSDDDFNDMVFYATSNTVDAISTDNVKPIDHPGDADGDGVTDVYDKFPNDPTRAFVRYFPAEDVYGTLAFEDSWPYTGDYDLNDMVVGYRYTYITNGQNKTVEMYGDYTINAMGAANGNGFAVQFPFASTKVSSVTGQRLTTNYITAAANGTEAGQTIAVIVPFDNTSNLLSTAGFINVYNGRAFIKSDTAHVKISFTAPITTVEMGTAPYNPFLIASQSRSREIHLPNAKPTAKADTKLFGTASDNSSTAANRYYLTKSKWPWALSFVEKFDHPTEASKISSAYPNFLNWARSGGVSYTDWYLNKAGNRNASMIYMH